MLIDNINCVKIEQREGKCVIDYIWNVIKGKSGFTSYNYNKLRDEMVKYCEEKNPQWKVDDGISTTDIIGWRLIV